MRFDLTDLHLFLASADAGGVSHGADAAGCFAASLLEGENGGSGP